MTTQQLYIGIALLFMAMTFSFIYILCKKIFSRKKQKQNIVLRDELENEIRKLADQDGILPQDSEHDFAERFKSPVYSSVLEDIIIEGLQDQECVNKKWLKSLAYISGFPQGSLRLLDGKNETDLAEAAFKIGLYENAEALPALLDRLDEASSEVQFQILTSAFMIGDIDAVKKTFEKIQKSVLINEKTVFDIIESFRGDKSMLYKTMFQFEVDYVKAIFLKAIDRQVAVEMTDEILSILHSSGGELKIAAIKALGMAGNPANAKYIASELENEQWEVRAVAAKALGELIDEENGEYLVKATCDRQWWVRQNAAAAILNYPNYEALFLSVLETGDQFAYDSIKSILNPFEKDLLKKLEEKHSAKILAI